MVLDLVTSIPAQEPSLEKNDSSLEQFINSLSINEQVKPLSLDNIQTFAKITEVHDGDSVTAIFPFCGINYKWKCRLYGIDTPVLKSKNAKEQLHAIEARDYLRTLILNKIVHIKCHKFDKYGRILITIDSLNLVVKDVVSNMVQLGFGHVYKGGTKEKWIYE